MANWKHHIDLGSILREAANDYILEDNDIVPGQVKTALADELKKAPPLAFYAGAMAAVQTVEELNDLLEEIYDEADTTLVWCGL